MLTYERHDTILELLRQRRTVKLTDLTEATGASESTIRRDLSELEDAQKLKRIHGGASLPSRKSDEPTMLDKKTVFAEEKQRIGRLAASFIEDGDSVYLDAGTSTEAMLPYIEAKEIVIVTNGLNIVEPALKRGFRTYVLGGYVKSGTLAFIGRTAAESLKQYRFDKAFLGTNGVDPEFGFSTPDPEEAAIKQLALEASQEAFVLADASKLQQTSFSRFASIHDAALITEIKADTELFLEQLSEHTTIEGVKP
ncbi:DeoR/GlpR family DNA-binding transcription regulator [Bacillus daqingensis]|uniref:DeoR/GlpR family DNA-binding transcription regulator n=1 Tax=Bacillus daqingensis TaxID=872396 RepID=A0ABV9NX71_9BACI